jgi:hypothetical protein
MAHTACITSFPSSPITRHANLPLITAEQANAIDRAEALESTTVKIGQIAVLDMRYSAYPYFSERRTELAIASLSNQQIELARFLFQFPIVHHFVSAPCGDTLSCGTVLWVNGRQSWSAFVGLVSFRNSGTFLFMCIIAIETDFLQTLEPHE